MRSIAENKSCYRKSRWLYLWNKIIKCRIIKSDIKCWIAQAGKIFCEEEQFINIKHKSWVSGNVYCKYMYALKVCKYMYAYKGTKPGWQEFLRREILRHLKNDANEYDENMMGENLQWRSGAMS